LAAERRAQERLGLLLGAVVALEVRQAQQRPCSASSILVAAHRVRLQVTVWQAEMVQPRVGAEVLRRAQFF
jgi:hypothetical protein